MSLMIANETLNIANEQWWEWIWMSSEQYYEWSLTNEWPGNE